MSQKTEDLSDFNQTDILNWMPKKTTKSRDNLRGEGIPLTPRIKKKNYRTIVMKEKQSRREPELKWRLLVEPRELANMQIRGKSVFCKMDILLDLMGHAHTNQYICT
jgi:hypothetical protein